MLVMEMVQTIQFGRMLNLLLKMLFLKSMLKQLGIDEGETVDLLDNVTATDIEDGDLTDRITVETNYHPGLSGTFDVYDI